MFCGFPVPRISDLPRQRVSPFCSRADAGAREVCPIAGTECHSSRRSLFPCCGRVDARARKACFIAPVTLFRSVAYWTREDASAVPRLPLPMNWQHNQKCERRPRPFCGFPVPRFSDLPRQWVSPFCSRVDAGARRACFIAGTECHSSRRSLFPCCGRVDARGRVCRSAASFAYELAAQSKMREEASFVLWLSRSANF